MNKVAFVWVLYESVPRGGVDRSADAVRMGERLEQLLDALMAFPDARVAVHVTGWTLEWLLDHRGATMDALGRLVRGGQVEMLAGTQHAAVYPSVPARDLLYQVRKARRLLSRLADSTPRGFWIPLGIWESDIPCTMAREGFRHTFLDARQLQVPPGAIRPAEGYWIVERLGYALSVLALDGRLGKVCQAGLDDITRELKDKANSGASLMAAATPFEAPGEDGAAEARIETTLAACRELAHRVRMVLPAEARRALEPSGVVRSPLRMNREVAERCVSPRVVVASSRKKRGATETSELAGGWLAAAAWDWFLDRFPETNVLHKKMLWMSTWVGRLERLLWQRVESGEDPTVLANALERARGALFLAQSQAAYWPSPEGGLYDPAVRQAAHESLTRVQNIVEAVFYPEARYVAHQQLDLDRDGRTEILTSTPCFNAGVSVSGGALFDLSYKAVPLNMLWPVGRRPELEHEGVLAGGVGRPTRRKSAARSSCVLALSKETRDRVRYDRYPRWSLLDHFLGADATAENFFQCRYPEAGDFVTGSYEIVRVGYERRAHKGEVHLARNGHVGELNARELQPLRVEKTFVFDDRDPTLEVRYAITNRGPAPVQLTFAPELSFAWPVQGVGFASGAAGSGEVRHRFVLTDEGTIMRGSIDEASVLLLAVPGRQLEMSVRIDRPAAWWWFPVETVSRRGHRLRLQNQGTVFLPRWELSLWGHETQCFGITYELRDPGEAPASVDIVDEGE